MTQSHTPRVWPEDERSHLVTWRDVMNVEEQHVMQSMLTKLNSHDALVAALRDLLHAYAGSSGHSALAKAQAHARAILAKVEL